MTQTSNLLGVATNCGSMDDESLGLLLQGLKEGASDYRSAVSMVSFEVHKRLLKTKGTRLPHSTLDIKRAGSPTYDVGKAKALTELLSERDAEELVSGAKANNLLKAYGVESEVGRAIIAARMPESTAFTITERK
jgi:hypothetical protein